MGFLLHWPEQTQFKVLYVSLPRKLLRSHYKNQALKGLNRVPSLHIKTIQNEVVSNIVDDGLL